MKTPECRARMKQRAKQGSIQDSNLSESASGIVGNTELVGNIISSDTLKAANKLINDIRTKNAQNVNMLKNIKKAMDDLVKNAEAAQEECCADKPGNVLQGEETDLNFVSSKNRATSCSSKKTLQPRQKSTDIQISYTIETSGSSSSYVETDDDIQQMSGRPKSKAVAVLPPPQAQKNGVGPHNEFENEPDPRKVINCNPTYYTYHRASRLLRRILNDAKTKNYSRAPFYLPYRFWFSKQRKTNIIKIQPLVIPIPEGLTRAMDIMSSATASEALNLFNPSERHLKSVCSEYEKLEREVLGLRKTAHKSFKQISEMLKSEDQ